MIERTADSQLPPLCCPKCGKRTITVAEGWDPFAIEPSDFLPTVGRITVLNQCGEHWWFESVDASGIRRRGLVVREAAKP